jgi:starch phosphorylase
MPVLRTFNVVPNLPARLSRLRDVANNLWWSWEPSARELFLRIDRDAWDSVGHNPIMLLAAAPQDRLTELAEDESFLAHLDRVAGKLDYYLDGTRWFSDEHGEGLGTGPVAYFSMEFGLHASVPIYSGGLGVLAGDHLKAASDLGVPMVGVGLFYRNGYFHQYLNSDGWQQERYPEVSPDELPLKLCTGADGSPLRIQVRLGTRMVHVQAWRLQVGRVPLHLLDTDIQENSPEDRDLTARLYGGDNRHRIQQEKILGVAGLRVLRELGFQPSVCHMNEGHSAFLGMEWARWLMETHGVTFEIAHRAVAAGGVFTTHTPVPAGNDEFDAALVREFFEDYAAQLGITMEEFLALGQASGDVPTEPFSMTLLAIRLSSGRNGVSELHGQVSRKMWQHVWPGVPLHEVPIDHVTNAVHVRTWLSAEYEELFDRYLGPQWATKSDDAKIWRRVDRISDTELWRAHERCRERLVATARRRTRRQLGARGAPRPELARAEEVLSPEALTIGFSRRFATYKRASLLFKDPERLAAILNDPERPVQIVFAGKAHPRDDAGKDLIRQIVHLTREDRFHDRVVFLEDYDMSLARYLVEGSDVWLNTPRRPLEASGTSGMKAVVNGVLQLSVLDGWWAEGYDPVLGWSIGSGEEYQDTEYQDKVESEALYDVLEQEIIPEFYLRGKDGLPRSWIERMKTCVREMAPRFTMDRMVKEYTERFYLPVASRFDRLSANGMERARALDEWVSRVREAWPKVAVERVDADRDPQLPVGASLTVRAVVTLGTLTSSEVTVQLYYGRMGTEERIAGGKVVTMEVVESTSEGALFQGAIPCDESGRHAFQVRVMPRHEDLGTVVDTGLVLWG